MTRVGWKKNAFALALSLAALLGPLAAPALAARQVLRMRLNGEITEAPNDAAGLMAMFNHQQVGTLREYVDTLRRAAADSEVVGLALIVEQPQVGLAQVEELTRALKAFRDAGKPVYCYLDAADNISYALAVAADHVTLAENSELDVVGLRAEMMYYKGLLDKIGVEADMLHCGAYKSALEPYTRTAPSPEAAENINWLLDGIYGRWLTLLAEGRKLTKDEMSKLVDQAPLTAEDALKAKLVDQVGAFNDYKELIQKKFGPDVEILTDYNSGNKLELDLNNPFAFFQLISQMMETASEPVQPGVGLIYIEGAIVLGPSNDDPFGGRSAGSTSLRAALEKARTSDDVRALVIRVNSPGGSALASDIIWKAATRCAQEKPVIVSMGGVAGSGGYYVALPADTIFADAATITGSIGVVGGKIVLKGLLEDKLGITTTEFTRGAHAGLMSSGRKWTDAERDYMQKYMGGVYDQFKARVRTSRGDRIKGDLEPLAGGRVYTGTQALEHGLIDRIGGLTDALDLAASKAGLGADYKVHVLPRPSGLQELLALLGKLTGHDEGEDDFDLAPASQAAQSALWHGLLPQLHALFPHQVRSIYQAMQNLTTLEREHVGCFMPGALQIR